MKAKVIWIIVLTLFVSVVMSCVPSYNIREKIKFKKVYVGQPVSECRRILFGVDNWSKCKNYSTQNSTGGMVEKCIFWEGFTGWGGVKIQDGKVIDVSEGDGSIGALQY